MCENSVRSDWTAGKVSDWNWAHGKFKANPSSSYGDCKSCRTVYCMRQVHKMIIFTTPILPTMKARVPAGVLDALWEYVEDTSARQRPCNTSATNVTEGASRADFKHIPILRATQKTDVCETHHDDTNSEEELTKWTNAEERRGRLVEVVTPNDLGNGDFTIRPSLTIWQRVCQGVLSSLLNIPDAVANRSRRHLAHVYCIPLE